MKVLKIVKEVLALQALSNLVLWWGCWYGSPKLAKIGLFLGADMDSKMWHGNYSDSVGGKHNDYWTGSIFISPIVVAATRAFGKKDDMPYRKIIKMLAQKGADTSHVVVGDEKTWFRDDDYFFGVSPDEINPYYRTLTEVIKERKTKKNRFLSNNSPADSYPITDSMALYLHKFPKDMLAEKAKFLDQQTEKQRASREFYSRMPYEIMSWRRSEELARLAAHKKWLDRQNNG